MSGRLFSPTVIIGLLFITSVADAGGKGASVDPRFAATVNTRIGDKPVRLVLTGTALRTKYLLRVYSIASYVQEGIKVGDAGALARVDAIKQLHLIFERDVDGATLASSFRESIGMSHPAPAFAAELATLERYFLTHPVKQGDHVRLTNIPGTGLVVQLNAQRGLVIPGAAFARAAWEPYLGRKNIGVAIQSGLTSRL